MSIGPAQLLAELSLPLGLESRQPIVARYAETLEPPYDLVVGARTDPEPESGYAAFAIFNLLCSSLSDLLAGGHLIDHCYISQAYSVMRPALDACDLLELFAQDHSEAETWTHTDRRTSTSRPPTSARSSGRPGTTLSTVTSVSQARTRALPGATSGVS